MELQFAQLTGVELAARKATTPQKESSDGLLKPLWATLDGAAVSMPYIQALVADGRVFEAYVGNASTPITLDAAWANTDPDISLDVPTGVTVIPIRITVVYEAFGTDDVAETLTLCSKTLASASAGTAFTPINYRTRHTRSSACKVFVGPTVTSGYTTGAFELFRAVNQLCGTMAAGEAGPPNKFEWSIFKDGLAPMLEGDASMQTWAVSQQSTGYIQYVWAEIPSLPTP